MSLYDRDYSRELDHAHLEESYRGELSTFIKTTYKLIAASLIAAVAGAYVGMEVLAIRPNFLIVLGVELGLLFGMMIADKKGNSSLALMLLFGFTFATGLFLGPVLAAYVSVGMGHVITQAFVATAVTFGTLTLYAMNTKSDFTSWGKPLFFVLIGVLVASLLNYFIFKSPMLSLGISGVCAVLFSLYILFDTKNIINGVYTSPVMAAVSMYLNILNLFVSLLNILGFLNRD